MSFGPESACPRKTMLLIRSETKKVEVSIHQEILDVSYSWMSPRSLCIWNILRDKYRDSFTRYVISKRPSWNSVTYQYKDPLPSHADYHEVISPLSVSPDKSFLGQQRQLLPGGTIWLDSRAREKPEILMGSQSGDWWPSVSNFSSFSTPFIFLMIKLLLTPSVDLLCHKILLLRMVVLAQGDDMCPANCQDIVNVSNISGGGSAGVLGSSFFTSCWESLFLRAQILCYCCC